MKYSLFSPDFIRERLSYFQEKLLEPLDHTQRRTVSKTEEKALSQKREEKKQQIQKEFEKEDISLHSSKNKKVEESYIPNEPGIIGKFFSENLLAKL